MIRPAAILLLAAFALRAADDLDSQMKRFVEAFALASENAAEAVSSEQVFYQGAIPGLLHKLDPHSVFSSTPDSSTSCARWKLSTQKGFGTVVSILPGRVIVLQDAAGYPFGEIGTVARR